MIIPAILEKNFTDIEEKVELLSNYCETFQIDIVDNTVIKGETFLDITKIENLKTKAKIELDLMVKNPEKYVKQKIDNIYKACAHINAKSNLNEFIKNSKENNYITGISINNTTDLHEIKNFVDKIDFIQVMGVTPGGQARPFEKEAINKIKEIREKYSDLRVQIDGGVNLNTIIELKKLGISSYIVGSAIFNSKNPILEYKKLKKEIYEQ